MQAVSYKAVRASEQEQWVHTKTDYQDHYSPTLVEIAQESTREPVRLSGFAQFTKLRSLEIQVISDYGKNNNVYVTKRLEGERTSSSVQHTGTIQFPAHSSC